MSNRPSHRATCETLVRLLSDYVDKELSEEDVERLEDHLADCPPCEVFLNTFRKSVDLSARRVASTAMPNEMRDRLHSFLDEKTNPDTR